MLYSATPFFISLGDFIKNEVLCDQYPCFHAHLAQWSQNNYFFCQSVGSLNIACQQALFVSQ